MRKIYCSDLETWQAPALRLGGVGLRERMAPGFVSRDRGMRHHLVVQFHSEALVGSGGRLEAVGPGATMLWRPGQGHQFGREGGEWTHTWIYLRGLVVERELAAAAPACGSIGAIPNGFPLQRLAAPILYEVRDQTGPDAIIVECACRVLMRSLVRACRRGHLGGIPERFQRIRALIEDRLDEPWPVARLAREAGLSPSRFRAGFRACFGCPPASYLAERRLVRAQIQLGDQRLLIKEVAARVGLGDPLYFSRVFTRRFGCSPRAWRNSD